MHFLLPHGLTQAMTSVSGGCQRWWLVRQQTILVLELWVSVLTATTSITFSGSNSLQVDISMLFSLQFKHSWTKLFVLPQREFCSCAAGTRGAPESSGMLVTAELRAASNPRHYAAWPPEQSLGKRSGLTKSIPALQQISAQPKRNN